MRIAGIVLTAALLTTPAMAQSKPNTLQPDRLPGMCLTLSAEGSISLPCDGSASQKLDLPDDTPGHSLAVAIESAMPDISGRRLPMVR